MYIFGLVGKSLKHSFSKKYFEEKFQSKKITDYNYKLFEFESLNNFPTFIKQHKNIKGLNVTIPYKQKIIPYLDTLTGEAKKIGAVNCIAFSNNLLIGHNTDIYGFEQSLLPYLNPTIKNALILGSGGASKAVSFVLKKLNINYQIVSRNSSNKNITYSDLGEFIIKKNTLIINTTPLGMYPNIGNLPQIPYEFLTSQHVLFDLIYNPQKTKFLELGEKQGCKIINGKKMLILQAEKSWEIWTKKN